MVSHVTAILLTFDLIFADSSVLEVESDPSAARLERNGRRNVETKSANQGFGASQHWRDPVHTVRHQNSRYQRGSLSLPETLVRYR